MTLTVKDIKSIYAGKIELSERNIRIANEALDKMWEERLKERDVPSMGGRSGSCKFAAMFARNLFGGKLAGNANHVFVIKDGKILDLNIKQSDVLLMGVNAHSRFDSVLHHVEYREALTSCLKRLQKYEEWVLGEVKAIENACL